MYFKKKNKITELSRLQCVFVVGKPVLPHGIIFAKVVMHLQIPELLKETMCRLALGSRSHSFQGSKVKT